MSTPLDLNVAATEASHEDDGQTLTLEDREGQPYDPPATIVVAGSYSKHCRTAEARFDRELARSGRRKLPEDFTLQRRIQVAAACILSWDGIVADGAVVPCTRENAIALLSCAPWVREQVEEAMNDHAGFSKTASSSS